jgi:hypothetical protein
MDTSASSKEHGPVSLTNAAVDPRLAKPAPPLYRVDPERFADQMQTFDRMRETARSK